MTRSADKSQYGLRTYFGFFHLDGFTLAHGFSKNLALFVLLLSWISPCFGKSPYQILGIPEEASLETVKGAYLKLVKENHPDTSLLSKEEAQRRFKEIQSAWEEIQKKSPSRNWVARDKELARKEAESILEQALREGNLRADTLESLPQKRASQSLSPLARVSGRGPKEEGEWEAISSFFRKNTAAILAQNPKPEALESLLDSLQSYRNLTGSAVRDINSGLLEPFENWLLDHASTPHTFLSAVSSRLDRFEGKPEQRREILDNLLPSAIKHLGGNRETIARSLAEELFEYRFERVKQNPVRIHELSSLIPFLNSFLSPSENVEVLGNFLAAIESLPESAKASGGFRDVWSRAQRAVERVFQKNPELKQEFRDKTSFWKRFFSSLTYCDIVLGRIARRTP